MKKTALPAPTAGLATSILGMWKLESRTDVDTDGQTRIDPMLGKDPLGVLCFAPGYFAAQFMKRDRSAQEPPPQPFQGSNNSSAVNGYDAYFGTYTLDETEGTLTVRLEGSISAANIGSAFVRDVRVSENSLLIQLPTTASDGTPLTRTLTFSRIGQ